MKLNETQAWIALQSHYNATCTIHLRDRFAEDPQRGKTFSITAGDIYVDYSKQLVSDNTMELLFELARQQGVETLRDAMFAGNKINSTENRSVLHTALRNQGTEHIDVDGNNILPAIHDVLGRMRVCSSQIRSGAWLGFTGKPITSIVNIGIGGSDLGPHMVTEALKYYSDRKLAVHFVSNIDGTDLMETLRDCVPEETLFIVASKTFTTDETMTNAQSARQWLTSALGDELAVRQHFIAISTNADAVKKFGISHENMFGFWDWVGGRYSLTSAIGLSIMIAIGPDSFDDLLKGFYSIDEHFRTAPLEQNVPVILGLISIWNSNFHGATSEAILPYDQYLHLLPSYLQQANMESNGKSVTKDGNVTTVSTGPVIWGQPGTNGQHAFYQLLHQGTQIVPAEFIGFIEPLNDLGEHHRKLIANLLAQSQALAFGKTIEEVKAEGVVESLIPHKVFPGNRPSTTILISKLSPNTLGQLIALYEHKIFVQGAIWGINSFDQWGVELGKVLARGVYNQLVSEADDTDLDSSTLQLLARIRQSPDRS